MPDPHWLQNLQSREREITNNERTEPWTMKPCLQNCWSIFKAKWRIVPSVRHRKGAGVSHTWVGTKCDRHFLLPQKCFNSPILMETEIWIPWDWHKILLSYTKPHLKNNSKGKPPWAFFRFLCFPLNFNKQHNKQWVSLGTMQPLALLSLDFLWQLTRSQSPWVCRQVGL